MSLEATGAWVRRPPGTARGRGARLVDEDEARRIAVRSQLLDGSAIDVLDTVRRLGFLQLDPIAPVAPAQHLVLWSRLGAYDTAELDRLLWDERAVFEWDAFVWPIEELPLVRGLMRRWRTSTHYKSERWVREFLAANGAFRRYVLRELERRGPLLSRDLEDRSVGDKEERRWYGSRNVGLMLTSLHLGGEVGSAGRSGGQRLWDLAERVLPASEALPLREAGVASTSGAFARWACVPAADGWQAHRDASDGPVPDRVTFLSPFDRLIHDRDRADAVRLPLPARDVRAEGEARVRLLRPADPPGRRADRAHRARVRSPHRRVDGGRSLGAAGRSRRRRPRHPPGARRLAAWLRGRRRPGRPARPAHVGG